MNSKKIFAFCCGLMFIMALALYPLQIVKAGGFPGQQGALGSMQTTAVENLDFLSRVDHEEIELEDYNMTYRAADVILPYITLDGPGADEINEVIDELAEEIAVTFSDEEGMEDWATRYTATYSVFENDDLLSLMVFLEVLAGSPFERVLIFNLDKDSGDLMNNEDLLDYWDLDVSEEALIEENLRLRATCVGQRFLSSDWETYSNMLSFFVTQTLHTYWESLSDESILSPYEKELFFIDSTGTPSLAYTQFIPAGGGFMRRIVPLVFFPGMEDERLNPEYVKLANALDIDLDDDDITALIWPLGTLDKADNFKALSKLKSLYSNHVHWAEPDLVTVLDWDEKNERYLLKGKEAYFIVPRQKNAFFTMEQDYDGEGEFYSTFDGQGMNAILLIMEEGREDIRLSYRFREQAVSFIPKPLHGGLDVPEGFIIGPPLDSLEPEEDVFFSYDQLFEDSY